MTMSTIAGEGLSGLSPEVLLAALNPALLQLHAEIEIQGAESNEDHAEALLDIVRETLLFQASADAYLVTVAGTQGAGKTTLVREIYGLAGDVLTANLGQGERMPVVVTENSGITAPQKWVKKVSAGSDDPVARVLASDAEWAQAVRGLAPDVVVVGLDVPATFFEIDGAGFLLLPGYASRTVQNRTWQDRMRNALVSSPSCLIVTDRDRLASQDQQVIVDDLRRDFLDAVNPVVVVSRCDAPPSAQEQEQIVARVRESFGDQLGSDDVIFPGVPRQDAWYGPLRSRLREGFAVNSQFRARQLRGVQKVVSRDLKRVIDAIRRTTEANASLPGHGEYVEFLAAFSEAEARARDDFEHEIGRVLAGQRSAAQDKIKVDLDEHGGWGGVMDKVGHWFKARSDARRIAWEDRMIAYWFESAPSYSLRAQAYGNVQARLLSRSVPQAPLQASEQALVAQNGEGQLVQPSFSNEVATGLEFIAGKGQHADRPPDKDFVTAVRILPGVGLEALLVGAQTASVVPAVAGSPTAAPTTEQSAQLIAEFSQNRRMLLAGLLLIVGVDLADEDVTDLSIPSLASGVSSFLFGTESATGAAAMISTTVALAAVVAAATGAVVMAANREGAKDRQRAYEIVQGMHDHAFIASMNQFDDIMNYLRERLIARLRGHLHVDEKVSRQLGLRRAIADAESVRADLLSSLSRRLERV